MILWSNLIVSENTSLFDIHFLTFPFVSGVKVSLFFFDFVNILFTHVYDKVIIYRLLTDGENENFIH
jgi:hypothetical protein